MARQNGKTTLAKPLIIRELRGGKKIMHIAQNRDLPRQMFGEIADIIAVLDKDLLPRRRGKVIWPRYGSGQEEIVLSNGGTYRIAAANRGGARGRNNDLVIIDELREMTDHDVMAAAEPTLTMSADPQMVYFSNAGHDESVVLNAVRARAGKDESLAYLEWSAEPDLAANDRAGWAMANPAMGIHPSVLRSVEDAYRKSELSGTLSLFEVERLCRWVSSMRERLVDEYAWSLCRADEAITPRLPFMAVSMDPAGTRASAAIAWQEGDYHRAPAAVRRHRQPDRRGQARHRPPRHRHPPGRADGRTGSADGQGARQVLQERQAHQRAGVRQRIRAVRARRPFAGHPLG